MIKKIKERYNWGGRYLTNSFLLETQQRSIKEIEKTPSRTEIINFLLGTLGRDTTYLEIGVRNPDDNFNKINSPEKYSVDPGVEFKQNPVDFKLTSDSFFDLLDKGELLSVDIRFDVIFIDGLHLADQVERDIENSLRYLKDDGFVLMHDCNPPSEWHAREEFYYDLTPAMNYWNGTTWKAFYKFRADNRLTSACVDTDWGVGILSKSDIFNRLSSIDNPYFEYKVMEENRKEHLNLIDFGTLKKTLSK